MQQQQKNFIFETQWYFLSYLGRVQKFYRNSIDHMAELSMHTANEGIWKIP